MGLTYRQHLAKRDTNAEYAAQFPPRDKATKRKQRRQRMKRRELRWLAEAGIERDPKRPLI